MNKSQSDHSYQLDPGIIEVVPPVIVLGLYRCCVMSTSKITDVIHPRIQLVPLILITRGKEQGEQ